MDVGARHPHNLGGARRQEWGFPQIAGCQQGGGGGGCHGDADMYPWSRGRSGGLSDIDAIGQFSFLSEGTKPSQGPAMVCQAVRCRLGPQRLGFGSCSIRPGAGAGRRPPPPNGFHWNPCWEDQCSCGCPPAALQRDALRPERPEQTSGPGLSFHSWQDFRCFGLVAAGCGGREGPPRWRDHFAQTPRRSQSSRSRPLL